MLQQPRRPLCSQEFQRASPLLRTDLNPVQTLEDSTWMAVQEGETASSDCGGTSDLQEPSSASGEEVEGSETSDAAGLEVSPSRKRSRGGTLQNGDKTSQESPQQNRDTPVTAQRIPGKTALTHQSQVLWHYPWKYVCVIFDTWLYKASTSL